ncbi:MAG TPA: SCO family protein [Acidimicrobiales bacterium]
MSGPVDVDGEPHRDVPVASQAVDNPPPEGHAPIDRSAALAAGAPRVPANFIWWILGAVLVLSLGGLIAERLFSAAGLNPTATTTTTTPSATRVSPQNAPTPPAVSQTLGAALPSFMGLTAPSPRPAPGFTLTDQSGQPVTLPGNPARVVVLTFFDAPCNDICPVLAAEIEQADKDLGTEASDVAFVTVNTDPSQLAASDAAPAAATGLGALPNWHFATGPLATLNSVWKSYDVSISVNPKTGLEAHNDVMDFIDGGGFLRYRATPFADESSNGTYTLSSTAQARWAQGIAAYAERLIKQ